MSESQPPDREARVVRLLRAAAERERAPAALRGELAGLRARSGARRTGWLPAPVVRYTSAVTVTFAAAAAALLIALGGAAGPSIAQASALALNGPTAPAPGPDPGAPGRLLSARVGDLHFPNWQNAGGWRAVGESHSRVGQRTVTTIYYSSQGTRIAYAIVSTPVLTGFAPHDEPYMTIWQHGRAVIVWQEHGHTCLLAARGISPRQLWRLAALTLG